MQCRSGVGGGGAALDPEGEQQRGGEGAGPSSAAADDPAAVVVEHTEEEEEEADKKDGADKKGTARSCNQCRQSHTACETTRPCKRCVRIGKADLCADIPLRKRGRPKTSRKAPGAQTPRPSAFLPIEPKRPLLLPLAGAAPRPTTAPRPQVVGPSPARLAAASPAPPTTRPPAPAIAPPARVAAPMTSIYPNPFVSTWEPSAPAIYSSSSSLSSSTSTSSSLASPTLAPTRHPLYVDPRLDWSQMMADYERRTAVESDHHQGAAREKHTHRKRLRVEDQRRQQGGGEPQQHWAPQWDEAARLAMSSATIARPKLDEGWRMPPRLSTPMSLFGSYSPAPTWKDIYRTFPFLNEYHLDSGEFAVDDLRKPIAVVARSTEGFSPNVVWVNRSFCTIHGYSYAELLGAPITKISLMLTYPEIAKGLFTFLKTSRPPMSVSHVQKLLLRHRHKEERAVMMDCRTQFCYGRDGLPTYGIYCVDRWREDAMRQQELETERWIFSFQVAVEQQRLLGAVGEPTRTLPEQPFP